MSTTVGGKSTISIGALIPKWSLQLIMKPVTLKHLQWKMSAGGVTKGIRLDPWRMLDGRQTQTRL